MLGIYPVLLVLGSLFSLLDSAARESPYDAAKQSHDPAHAPSYFAKKSNIFNILFVKRGWFWVTASYLIFLFTHPSNGPARSLVFTPRRIRGLIRWGLVTIWWIFITQWFFGPAIIDRGFRLTGGQCELVREAQAGQIEMDETRQLVTGIACKTVGGEWKGGHDISGHVFLLVLGSFFLFEEVLHVFTRSATLKEERMVYMLNGDVKSADVEILPMDGNGSKDYEKWDLGVKSVIGVLGLSLWMLLMTAIYFHTWFEKFTGLIVALTGIFVVYFIPRFVPALRGWIGLPGV